MSAFSDAVLALSPSSYWRFEGASPLADSGSAGITLTAVNSPSRVASIIPCEAGASSEAYALNGTTQSLHAGDAYDFSAGTDWTLSGWFSINDASAYGTGFRRLFEKRLQTGDNNGWLFYGAGSPAPAATQFDFDNGATAEGHGADTQLLSGVPAWLVFTWVGSSDTYTIYVNGALVTSNIDWSGVTPAWPGNTANFTIGADSGGTSNVAATVDDVAVWDGTALSAANVRNLWEAAQYPFVMPHRVVG